MWFSRQKSYDRFAILAAAEKARGKRRVRKAVTEYRKLLEVDPYDHETQGKVAPLLAERGQLPEAWSSFVAAGKGYLRDGHGDKALSIYMQASRYLPRQTEVWETIARLQVGRGRHPDAVMALLEGSRHFRRRNGRPQAIHLLRQAYEIEPWHFEATLELARQLAKADAKGEALHFLHGLAARAQGRNLRRVRGTLFRMSPSLAAAWRWLRAAVAAREIPFPRISSWNRSATKRAKWGQLARVTCLTLALMGILVVGVSFHFDVGLQKVYFVLGGSGLALIGLASFLLF
ncbi:MAG: tetratricopeptide repeat protein [Candidatus Methylomirabilales bacterium]